MKIYIHYHPVWIIKALIEEWVQTNRALVTTNPQQADIIWVMSYYMIGSLPPHILKSKKVVTTFHHIYEPKFQKRQSMFKLIDQVTDQYHAISPQTATTLRKYTQKPILVRPFWIQMNKFPLLKNIPNSPYESEKGRLLTKYQLPPLEKNILKIGSFQRDTEGDSVTNKQYLPKLEKGPDIFLKIIEDKFQTDPNLLVILAGPRREYLTSNFDRLNIPYRYFGEVTNQQLRELYLCLDLYIVTGRAEGQPRAILECASLQVPIISTQVGMAPLILPTESLFQVDQPLSYRQAEPRVNQAYEQVSKYNLTPSYLNHFNDVFKF